MPITRTISILILAVAVVPTAYATNGYFTHGIGVKNKSLAGAGTAMPSEAISAASNPAAAVMVGEKFEVGLSLFSPRRSYEASESQVNGNFGAFTIGPASIDSDKEYFIIPYVAKTWAFRENSALGVSFYGRGGMNTKWHGGSATLDPDGPGPAPVLTLPGTFGGGTAGVNLSQAFLDVTAAFDLGSLNVGFSGVLAVQGFKAEGLVLFSGFTETFAASGGTQLPRHLTDNGTDFSFGYGVKVGAIFEATDRLNLGISYASKTSMTDLDDYADLFAEGGGFDIPASGRLSVSYMATPEVSLHFDWERTWFSDVDSVGNSISNIFACPTAGQGGMSVGNCLGGKNGAGFGWDDVAVFKFGVQWVYSNKTTFRAGYSSADQPIPKSEVLFNILAPAVIEQHFTLGFTRILNNAREWSMAFMYAPSNDVKGANTFDPTQTLEIEMHQFEIEFGYVF